MSFVLVSADCSCCKPDARVQIYGKLTGTGWVQMSENSSDVTSVWLGSLPQGVSEEEAMNLAKENFYSCFNPNCKPAIVFHWSVNELNQSAAV